MSSYIKECLGLSSQNTQTFRVSHKKAEVFTIGSTQEPNEKIVQLLERQKRPCTEILESTKFPLKIVAQSNGFVNTLLEAYNQHHNLVIRPDDVWGAIIIQFSFYVTKHLEEFREKFIEFPGKKRLEIDITGNATTTPYQAFIKAVTKEVDLNLEDVGLKDWVLPNFSTTTENDVVTTGVVLMAAMKQYFTHGCNMLCGIPSVTLEGTLEDWEEIYTRLGRLKEFELERWYGMLEPVLKQFVNSKMGKVDKAFWQRICHYEKFGSGETHLSGWITAFCVFDWEGNWQGEGNGLYK